MLKKFGKNILSILLAVLISLSFNVLQYIVSFLVLGAGALYYKLSNKFSIGVVDYLENNEEFLTTISGTIIYSIVLFIFLIVLLVVKNKPFKKMKISEFFFYPCLGLVIHFSTVIFMTLFTSEEAIESHHEYIEEATNFSNIFALIMLTGIVGPLVEELLYRYSIVSLFKNNKILGIIISGLIFGLAHGNNVQRVYAGLSGVFYAAVFACSGNIFSSVLCHSTFNLASLLNGELGDDFVYVYFALVFISFVYVLTYIAIKIQLYLKNRKEIKNAISSDSDIYSRDTSILD